MLAYWEDFWYSWEGSASNTSQNVLDLFKYPFGPGNRYPKVTMATAAPLSGPFKQGDIVINRTPSAGGTVMWVCISEGPVWRTISCVA